MVIRLDHEDGVVPFIQSFNEMISAFGVIKPAASSPGTTAVPGQQIRLELNADPKAKDALLFALAQQGIVANVWSHGNDFISIPVKNNLKLFSVDIAQLQLDYQVKLRDDIKDQSPIFPKPVEVQGRIALPKREPQRPHGEELIKQEQARQEQERRHAEEQARQEQERRRAEEQARQEQERRRAEEQARQEQERRRAEEKARQEQERRRAEEQVRQEQESTTSTEEQVRQEQERRRTEEQVKTKKQENTSCRGTGRTNTSF